MPAVKNIKGQTFYKTGKTGEKNGVSWHEYESESERAWVSEKGEIILD